MFYDAYLVREAGRRPRLIRSAFPAEAIWCKQANIQIFRKSWRKDD